MILTVRGLRVILDVDLAALYGVTTKVFNQAVKRNHERFPGSFMFQLKRQGLTNLRSQFVTSSLHGGRRFLPYAFTEHGALMAANVLSSPQAIKMSVALIEAFIRLRQELATTQTLARRLAEIERTVIHHDSALKELFRVIRPMLAPPPEPPRKKIGFDTKPD
jgi:hypothetical protein